MAKRYKTLRRMWDSLGYTTLSSLVGTIMQPVDSLGWDTRPK